MSMNSNTPLLINTHKNNCIYLNNLKIHLMLILLLIIVSISTINLIFLLTFNNLISLNYNEIEPYLNKTKSIIDIVCLDINC